MRETVLNKTWVVDMDNSAPPSLVFNNPIFYDVSNIKANRTTTYRIPLTEENQAKIGRLCDPDYGERVAGNFFTLDEYRDGVPIIENAQAILLQASPSEAEFSVTWGVLKNVQELLRININDLSPVPPLRWNDATEYAGYLTRPDYGFLRLRTFDSDTAPDESSMQYHFPSVNVLWLMRHIAENTGINMTFDEVSERLLRDDYIPLLRKNSSPNPEATSIATLNQSSDRYGIGPVSDFYVDQDEADIFYPRRPITTMRLKVGRYKFTTTYQASQRTVNQYQTLGFRLTVNANGKNTIYEKTYNVQGGPAMIFETSEIIFDVTEDDVNVNGTTPANITFYANGSLIQSTVYNGSPADGGKLNYIRFDFVAESSNQEIAFGDDFPIILNLPRMTALDFIKDMMFKNGLYVTPVGTNGLHFSSIDQNILSTYNNAQDLTNKVATRLPKNMKYTFSDYAQVNTLSYADDETVRINANGSIDIDDATLADVKEMVKLKFAASDTYTISESRGYAIVPIYRYVTDDQGNRSIEYNGDNIQPRIVKRSPDGYGIMGRDSAGQFPDEFLFPNIINANYRVISAILREPTVMSVDVYVSTVDISMLSNLNKFYAYGGYWIMVNGTVSGNVLSADFIRLPIVYTN